MAMSRDVVLRLIGDAESAKKALHESAEAAGVTVREYRRAETLQRQQAAQAKRLAAEQAAAAQVVGSSMLKMGAVVTGALALGVKAAVDWESAFADVKKVMKDPAMFGTVEAQLRQLTSVLPATHAEIAAVAAAAAQLGVEDHNIASFTKTMIMLGTTTSMQAEEAAFAIARFSNIMGTSTSQASNLGSAIVWLGNNFAATEGEIVAMSMRLAGAGKQAGMTEGDILGISTALAAVGIEAEAGGTAMSKFMTRVGAAVRDGGKDLEQFAKLAGTTATDFAKQWREDPAKALASVVTGMGNLQKAGGDLNGELDKLGITEIRMRDALLRSSAAGDLLTDAITGANDAFAENNALQEEANQRYETTASQLQLLRNGVTEAGISLGQALLPALNLVVDAVGFVVDGFNALPGPVKSGIAILLGVVGASALAGGAFIKLQAQATELRSAFATMTAGGGFMGKLGGFLGVLGPVAAGIGIVTAAVSILSGVFSGGIGKVKNYDEHVQSLTDSLRESNGVINDTVREAAKLSLVNADVADALERAGVSMDSAADAVLGNKDAYEQVIAALDAYIAANDRVGWQDDIAAATAAKGALEDLADGSAEAAGKAKALAEATDGQRNAAAAAGQTTEEYAQAQAEAADATDKTKKAVDELKSAFDRLNGANIDLFAAQAAMTLGLAEVGKAAEQNGASLDRSTEAGAKNYQMFEGLVGKAEDMVTATLQQTESVAEANKVYQEQRETILAAAEASGYSRDQVSALLDQIFQMPTEIQPPVELPGAAEALEALEALNAEAFKASDGTVQIKAEALTQEARDELAALGLTTTRMPDGSFLVTAQTDEAQAALESIKGASDLIDGAKLQIDVEADAASALSALTDVGAVVEQTPNGKEIVVDALTEDAKLQLEAVGLVALGLPDGRNVIVSAPGAAGAAAAIDGVNQAAVTLSNGETVPILAPGATSATGEINDTNQAAIQLSNGEIVPISAPGATNSSGQIQDVSNKANALPSQKTVKIDADTSSGMAKIGGFASALAGLQNKTVTVNQVTVSSSLGLADGGHVKFFAGGGEHHVAQYAPAGTWRVWAEPETGGEWYLPHADSKRPRSLSIAGQMLDSWGYQMVPKGAQQYAHGAYAYGQYAYGPPVIHTMAAASSGSSSSRTFNVNGVGMDDVVRELKIMDARDEALYGAGR